MVLVANKRISDLTSLTSLATNGEFVVVDVTDTSQSPTGTNKKILSSDLFAGDTIHLLKSGGTMSGVLNMGSNGITNLSDPTNAQDAATKNYVDTHGGGGGGGTWGSIVGTLSSQTDLQTALNAKEPTISASTTAKYWRGDKTFQTLNTDAVPEAANLYYTDIRVRLNRLDQMTVPNNALNLNAQLLTNVGNPISAQDAATKSYVDGVATGLSIKNSVVAATTTTLPAYTFSADVLTATSNGAFAAVDGVTLSLNDRLLVKNETGGNAKYNGLYSLTQVGDGSNPYKLTRTTDADTSGEMASGAYCFVTQGTVNAATGWVLTTANPITLDTTSLTFTQFSASAAFAAGTGITIASSTISLDTTYTDGRYTKKAGDTMTGLLQFSGTGHAGLQVNSLTTTQRNALTAANGMLIYNSTLSQINKYENSQWVDVSKSPATKVVAISGSGYSADYYATGTNDHTTISNAAAAVSSAGGGNLFVRAGTYNFAGSISWPSNVNLICEGWNTIFKLVNSTNTDLFVISGKNTILFRDFLIDGNSPNQTTASNGIKVSATSSKIYFENIYVKNTTLDGIQITSCSDFRLLNCFAFQCGKTGVSGQGNGGINIATCSDFELIGCKADSCQYEGINIFTCHDFSIAGGKGVNSTVEHGLHINLSYNFDITGGDYSGNTIMGVKNIDSYDYTMSNLICNNNLSYGISDGVNVGTAYRRKIIGCTANGNVRGIVVADNGLGTLTCIDSQIIGNTTVGNSQGGLVLSQSSNNIVSGNISKNNQYGIQCINTCNNNTFSNNRSYDDQAIKTQLYGLVDGDYSTITGNDFSGNLNGDINSLGVHSRVNGLSGTNYTIQAGANSTGTDVNGNTLLLIAGQSTGVGNSFIDFQVYKPAASTANTNNSAITIWRMSQSSSSSITLQPPQAGSTGNLTRIKAQDANGSDHVGGDLSLESGNGRGTGSSNIKFLTAAAGTTGSGVNTSTERARIDGLGRVGIGVTSPTAFLHLLAGTATANTAPLKLTTGANLATPEDGAIEYSSSHLYFTIGSTRYQIDQQTSVGTVTAIVGTANQVLANGTSGSNQTGAVTLTLPQNIATGSSPTFAGLTLTGLSGILKASAGVLAGSAVLNDIGAATGDYSINSHKLTNLTDPTSSQDAATKAYVDSVAAGLTVKNSVRLATVAALPANTYSNGTSGVGATLTASSVGALTVDGVATALNDRILVQNEATASHNGIYQVTTLGTAGVAYVLTRTTDMDQSAEIDGSFCFVEEGSTNADAGFVCTTTGTVTMGSTAINFTQFSGAAQITAGAGMTKTGNTLDVIGTANRILVNADSIDISATYVGQSSITTLGTITTGTWNAGAITANTSGSSTSVVINDTGTNGANIKLTGNGGTTPSKFIRSHNGVLEILNNAYSSPIFTVDDSGNITAASTITVNNPSLATGLGVLLKHNGTYSATVASGNELDLITLDFHNTQTTPSQGEFYGIKITTDSDVIDSAAGISISNIGKSDAMYISMAGKSGATATTPTGIGLDMNRSGSGENSTANAGRGIQIWDFSSTDQGVGGGPTGLYLNKQNNLNSEHRLMIVRTNRNGIYFEVPEGAGYDATKPLMEVNNTAISDQRFRLEASGNAVFKPSVGALWNQSSGNQVYIQGTTANQLDLRIGVSGMRFIDNGNTVFLTVNSSDEVSLTTSGSSKSLLITDTGTNGANVKLVGNGVTTPNKYIRSHSGVLEIINSGYSAAIFSLSDTGVITASTWNGVAIDHTYLTGIVQADVGGLTTASSPTFAGLSLTGAETITSASANALAVGANGTTHPVLKVDASASSVATGLLIQGQGAGSGLNLSPISSSVDEDFMLDPLGSGNLKLMTVVKNGIVEIGTRTQFDLDAIVSLSGITQDISTDGATLDNTTAATNNAQQFSPRLRLRGRGWKTNATAGQQTVDWIVENQPVQGAAAPSTNLVTSYQIGLGGYSVHNKSLSSGAFDLASGGVFSINGTSVLSATTLGSGVTASSLTSVGTLSSLTLGGTLNMGTQSINTVGNIEIDGTAARDITVGRATSGNGANQTIVAGGGQNGATNASGGDLIFKSGITTGSGGSLIRFFVPTTGGSGATDVNPTEQMNLSSNGRLAIGTGSTAGTNRGITLTGQNAEVVQMIRTTTAATTGFSLTLQSGGAKSGGTDLTSGALLLQTGLSTGNSVPGLIQLQSNAKAAASGIGDNALIDRMIISAAKVLTNNSAINLVNCTLASNTVVGGIIRYAVEVFDATNLQMETGEIMFQCANKGGVFSGNTMTQVGSAKQFLGSGTLAMTWAITGANPAVISLNANSSLTPTTGYPRITYTIENFTQQAIAIQ